MLIATLAVVIGVLLGLLGGGGSALTVPLLVYGLGMGASEAIATSLAVVALASGVGFISYARRRLVLFRTGLALGAVAMFGAYLGGYTAQFLPDALLLTLLGVTLVAAAAVMLRRRTASPQATAQPLVRVALVGVAIGFISGLVGVGGGFLLVPALLLWTQAGMRRAVGTSLLVISIQATAGLAGQLSHVSLNPQLTILLAAAGALGVLVGSRLSALFSPARLKRAFAIVVLGVGAFVFVQQLSSLFKKHAAAHGSQARVSLLLGSESENTLRAGGKGV